jgi:hypothetical protein
MHPLLVNCPSAAGAECFLHALIRDVIDQQEIHPVIDLPGFKQLLLHALYFS